MYLCYFDEVKTDPPKNMNFFIGGIAINSTDLPAIEATVNQVALNFFGSSVLGPSTEFHGNHILHGKGACKGRKVADRIALFDDLIRVLDQPAIHKFVTRLDVMAHRRKYAYPMPEYNLGLMLHIEQTDIFLRDKKARGLLFGDFERDNANNSIVSLSEFRTSGTSFYYGFKIINLMDTPYFAHSHHSRLIQLADVFMYLAQLHHYNDRSKSAQAAVLLKIDESMLLKRVQKKTWP